MYEQYIQHTPEICSNAPTLIGRRLTVYHVVTQIRGDGFETALETYEITRDQAMAALHYCSELKCKIDSEQYNFCENCKLDAGRNNEPPPVLHTDKYIEFFREDGSPYVLSKDGETFYYPFSLQDLKDETEGIETWLVAKEILKHLTF